MATQPAQLSGAQIAQINAAARGAVLQSSVEMTQQIFTQTVVPANQSVLNIVPRNVGLIKGFWVKVAGGVQNTTAGAPITPTDFGAANVLSQVIFTDLQNNVRINTSGRHLDMLNSVKGSKPWLDTFTPQQNLPAGSQVPVRYAESFGAGWIDSSIAQASTEAAAFNYWYWIPLAYSDVDLRGGIYANVVNSTMNLQLTINTQAVVASTADTTNAVYAGVGGTGAISSVTVTVYQQYLDQLPIGQNGPILPLLDLSTIYELKTTTQTGMATAQDFPTPYANFRDFLSTFATYVNGVTRNSGSDVNYWALQSANFTNLYKIEPQLVAIMTRQRIRQDLPPGAYYFDHRSKPINTVQYGNMELVLNANGAVAANSRLEVAYESFARVNSVTQAGSLAAG